MNNITDIEDRYINRYEIENASTFPINKSITPSTLLLK